MQKVVRARSPTSSAATRPLQRAPSGHAVRVAAPFIRVKTVQCLHVIQSRLTVELVRTFAGDREAHALHLAAPRKIQIEWVTPTARRASRVHRTTVVDQIAASATVVFAEDHQVDSTGQFDPAVVANGRFQIPGGDPLDNVRSRFPRVRLQPANVSVTHGKKRGATAISTLRASKPEQFETTRAGHDDHGVAVARRTKARSFTQRVSNMRAKRHLVVSAQRKIL